MQQAHHQLFYPFGSSTAPTVVHRNFKSQILVSSSFGACVNMLMFQNPCCLAVIPNSLSSTFLWEDAPSALSWFKSGHICLIARTTWLLSIRWYSILVTLIGFVLITLAGLIRLSFSAAFLSMNGHIPILPSVMGLPSLLLLQSCNRCQEHYLHRMACIWSFGFSWVFSVSYTRRKGIDVQQGDWQLPAKESRN